VDPATLELIRGMVWEFPNIAKERVFEEISKLLLKAEKPSVGLEFLLDSGWLRWFPELNEMAAWSGWDLEENAKFHGTAPEFLTSGCPQNPDWHPEGDVWIHNGMVVDAAARVRHRIDEEWRLAFMLGALLHDIAKPITTELPVCTAHGHDSKGEELAETFLGRLTNERKLIDRVVSLVANHLRPFQLLNGEAKPAAWKRLHKRALNRLDVLGWMSRADWAGRPNRDPLHATENGKVVEHKASAQCWDWHEELGIDPVVPVLMGRHLIAAGFRPGPGFKVMLDAAFEAQLEDEGLGLEELLEVATAVG
jgi:tRNA nucleotidyltransferase (CCA-adding enzyme)